MPTTGPVWVLDEDEAVELLFSMMRLASPSGSLSARVYSGRRSPLFRFATLT